MDRAVEHSLGAMAGEAQKAAWERWISPYWNRRLTGDPRPLTNEELNGMVEWAMRLRSVFPEAVEKVVAAPVVLNRSRMIFFDLRTSDLVTLYPTSSARLIHHILRNLSELLYECGFVDEVMRRLLGTAADRGVLLEICEEMARLGCRTAGELRRAVTGAADVEPPSMQ